MLLFGLRQCPLTKGVCVSCRWIQEVAKLRCKSHAPLVWRQYIHEAIVGIPCFVLQAHADLGFLLGLFFVSKKN